MSELINNFVKTIFNTDIKDTEYNFISEFTFLWSVFESKLKKNDESLNLKRIESQVNSIEFKHIRENSKLFTSIPDFIYIEILNDDIILAISNIDFKISLFPTERKKEFDWFKNHFEKYEIIEKVNTKTILLMCFICYRLRNNLFHGNKKFDELHQQKKLFNLFNNFLSELLIKLKI
jgi:hypothetical protein